MTQDTTTTSGAADLPEALRSIQRFEVVDCIDDKHVPAVIPKPHGPWVRYGDHIAALASTPAQPAGMTDDEKHLRRMLCVAHAGALAYMDDGEASDSRMHPTIDFLRDSPKDIQRKIGERNRAAFTAAPAQPVAEQGVAYAALPESFLEIPDVQDESGINAYYSREVVLECIDAALASHGQAPAHTPADSVLEDAEIDRIVPALEPVSEDFPAEWAVWKDRERIREELRAARKQGGAT